VQARGRAGSTPPSSMWSTTPKLPAPAN